MRFGHFHEIKENPERRLFDQQGNFLKQEVTQNQSAVTPATADEVVSSLLALAGYAKLQNPGAGNLTIEVSEKRNKR